MRRRAINYTRFIQLVKVIMPLVAIALLSTVFLFTKNKTLEGGFEFAKADFLALESGMQVTKPRISGSNKQGDTFYFSASVLVPDAPKPEKLTAQNLSGEIRFLDGVTLDLSARAAEMNITDHTIQLSGEALVVFSNGLRATTDHVFADLDNGSLTTDGDVRAVGEMGVIEAGNLRIETIRMEDSEKRMIWFENNVKVVLNMATPEQNKANSQ